MSPRVAIPDFFGASATVRPVNAGTDRTINWIAEASISGNAKVRSWGRRTPGFRIFGTPHGSPARGIYFQDDRAAYVGGSTFYGFLSDGTFTSHGTVTVDAFPTTLNVNGSAGHQLMITSGGYVYIYDYLANTFTQVTAPDLVYPARMGIFIDGYFAVLKGESRAWQISALEDGTSWDALDIAERSAGSDDLIAIATVHKEVWLMGSRTSEVWYNSGNADFPFEPINGVFINAGCCAPFSVQPFDNSLVWVGLDASGVGLVYKANQFTPQRISTTALEEKLQEANWRDTLRYAQAWVYQQDGHLLYLLYVPGVETTWAYDASTGIWTEWATWNATTCVWEPHRGVCHAFAYGMHLIGDRAAGAVYELRDDLYDEERVTL